MAKKACNEKTKPSTGKNNSAGPERSSASSLETHQATGLKPAGSPQHNTGHGVSSAQRAAWSSRTRLEFFQRKPSPAGHFSAPPSSRLLHCAPAPVISREGDGWPHLPWGHTAGERALCANMNCSAGWRPTPPCWSGAGGTSTASA